MVWPLRLFFPFCFVFFSVFCLVSRCGLAIFEPDACLRFQPLDSAAPAYPNPDTRVFAVGVLVYPRYAQPFLSPSCTHLGSPLCRCSLSAFGTNSSTPGLKINSSRPPRALSSLPTRPPRVPLYRGSGPYGPRWTFVGPDVPRPTPRSRQGKTRRCSYRQVLIISI